MSSADRFALITYALAIGILAIVVPEPLLQGLGVTAALLLLLMGIGGGPDDD